MLDFPQNLQDELEKLAVEPYWLLRLYYNDESVATNWIGVSGQDRTINSDEYYGILNAPGGYHQSLDIFDFDSSTGEVTLTLINTPDSLKEHNRFSDLWNTLNFANRKWILYQFAEGLADADKGQIATGLILGEAPHDDETMELTLLDLTGRINVRTPTAIVTGYPNAPKKNVDRPVPYCFGDFDVDPNAPDLAAGAAFDRHFTKGKFPAIITDKWDYTNGRVEAKGDNQLLNQVRTKNLFMFLMGFFIACEITNVTDSNPILEYEGDIWRLYVPLGYLLPRANGTNWDRCTDADFTTFGTLVANQDNVVDDFRFPKVPNMGEIETISFLISKEVTGVAPIPGVFANAIFIMAYGNDQGGAYPGDIYALGWDDNEETIDITATYPNDKTSWNLEGRIELRLDDTNGAGGARTCDVYQVGIEIEFRPSQLFEKKAAELYEVVSGYSVVEKPWGSQMIAETVKRTRTKTIRTPTVSDYVYFSGKGRNFFAEIDTEGGDARNDINGSAPDPGYGVADLIENPIYIAEELLRDQGGLDQDGISLESFDLAGEGANGTIKNVFDLAVANIKFAYSQFRFINLKDALKKVGSQCGTTFFNSGDGKVKAFVLQKAADYTASDITFDFNDCELEPHGIFKTPPNNVRNYIRVHYKYDYAEHQNTEWAEPAVNPDGVSNLWTVNGFGQQLKLIIEADCIIDSATATALAQYLQDRFKNRFEGFALFTKRPKYNRAEIGDIADFTNFPSDLKVYGATQSGYYVIVDNTKFEDYARFTFLKVS